MDAAHLALIAVAAVAGGAINAIAGGGSLITFPALLASGVPAIAASMTNTVAMCPGYFTGTFAQRTDLEGQLSRALWLVPASLFGSLVGAYLLLHTNAKTFDALVPVLLVFAAALLAAQAPLKRWLGRRTAHPHAIALAMGPVALGAVYGSYFGAGLGVILLAVLAVVIDDKLVRTNALKQLLSLSINTCGAIVFVITGTIEWPAAAALAVGSMTGGFIGGRLVRRVREDILRAVVIAAALALAAIYFVRDHL